MKRVLSLILIFVTVFAVAACSSKKKKDVIKEQVTKEISSEEGGTVSTSDESVSVEIPGDALDSNTQITVTIYESSHHATAEGEQIMSHIVEFEPSGTIFKKPIIITMRSTENIKNKVVSAAVYNEAKGEWSYSKHGAYAVIVGKDEAGDPIMQSAAGDPIMLNAAGDPIMMNAAGDPIMMAAAGDPIMLAAAGDPIMTNAAGDPIMNAAAGDPIMMTTGHFTAYAFITSKDEETADNDTDTGDDDDADNDADADEPVYVPECGNGIVDEGEECDGGADSHELRGPEAACRKDCTLVRCGDSILDDGEECDDGNTKDGDYCSADCKTVTGSCGDGTKQDNEECDDGNTKDGDYCSPDCQTVTGSCGDGKKQSNEACDKADPEYGEGEGIGASCSDDCQIVTLSCGTLPSNAEWVSGDTYEATWNGEEYSSASAHYAEEGDCAYKCKATYSWIDSSCKCQSTEHVEDGVCKSNTLTAASCGTLPANAQWVSGDTYIPTWNGTAYSSAAANYAESGDCAYKCKTTYSWIDSNCTCTDAEHVEDGVCKSNTLAAASCGELPANAQWVSGDTYIPTWNGTAYSSAAANYAESGDCAYKCKATYSWIDSNCTCTDAEHVEDGVCKSNTQAAASCGELPANAQWVGGDTYVPTWNGSAYSSATANYAEEGDCAYQCKPTYTWVETNETCACTDAQHVENDACVSNTGEAQNCTNIPANAAWKVGTYTPHWVSGAWSTEPAATYFEEEGEECTFECVENFHYEEGNCQSDTKPAESCGTLPANAQWISGETYVPTWYGEDYSSASAHYAEEGDCAYKCKATYIWVETNGTCACPAEQHVENDACVSDTGTAQNCTNLPSNAAWVAATYIPHWSNEAWSTEPEATYFEDEGEECTFNCVTDYHYEDGSCKSDTLAAASCGELPENAQWVGGSTYIPTWDGEEYSSATANYAEEGDCAFLCSGDYEWNEDTMQCRAPLAKVLCTGQTKCFSPEGYVIDCPAEGEEFYGQDANYTARHSCTPQTYEKISEERNCIAENDSCNIVDDLSTGLRWYIYSNGGTWENAYTFCDTLDTGDGREWRLPTAKELMSIIDSGTSYPALRLAYFGNEFSSYNSYWSGTYYLNAKTGQDEVLVMDVGYGHLQYDTYGKEGSNYFACVSGEEYGVAGTFTEKNISGGTVVTDSATDLMWKAADDLNMTWDQAIAYCENLEYAGFYDWRLPNRNEFATILNYDKGFADNKSDFPGIIGGNYWTSTFAQTYGGSARAFIMEVGGGTMFGSGDTNGGGEGIRTAYTLCVRNDDLAEYQAVPVCDESGYTPCEDPETGIVWSQNINTDRYDPDYFMAARMCRESNNGGISQWRIPTIDEIRTILKSDVLGTGGECHVTDECNDISDENCYDSEICETGLPIESIFYNDSYMVSSTTLSEDENHAWGVDFFDGSIVSYARNDDLYPMITVRCVKDENIPERVTFPYTDDETSLVWSELSEYDLRWSEASEYCTEDEEHSWRLPTIEELETLVQGCHDGGCSPDVSGGYSALNDVSILWSSTITRNQLPTNVETYYNVLDFMTASQVELTTDQIREYSAKVRCVAYPNACKSDPCLEIENSDGTCTSEDGVYICGCVEGYFWNGEECKLALPLGNICTNQTNCYNFSSSMTCPAEGEDFFGQDAQYTNKCTAQSFTAGTGAQAGTVIDNNTGLVWEQSPSENEYTWDDAHNHCDDLNSANYGGKNNWRVPNPLEFMTIVDNSTYNPATNSNFTNMPSDSSAYFWTSAEFKGNTSYAYAFKPYYGSYYGFNSDSYLKTNTYKVLCVSGEEMQPATSADFTTQTISGKVVVTDSKTGLMWQKEYETDQTWQQALKYCEDSTYAGYSDWRLPNKNELTSLVNYEKSGVPYSYFPDMPSNNYFWSSSTYVDNTYTAWGAGSYSGGVGENGKRSDYNVRCVR